MKLRSSTLVVVLLAIAAVLYGCGARSLPSAPTVTTAHAVSNPLGRTAPTDANVNGSGSNMPTYYAGQLFTINFTEIPPRGETSNQTHNTSITNIYQSHAGLPGG